MLTRVKTQIVHINAKISSELAHLLEAWRRDQDPIPTRSEAIRVLIVLGLEKDKESSSDNAR